MTRWRAEAWIVCLLLGVLASVGVAFGSHRWAAWGAAALQVAAGLVVVAGIRRRRPERPAFWVVTAAGIFGYAVAQLPYRTGPDAWRPRIPFGGLEDWLLYAAFGLFTAALAIAALGGLRAGNRRTDAIDGFLVVLGISAVSWQFVAEPFLALGGLTAGQTARFWFYELFELVRISLLALIFMSPSGCRTTRRLLLIGMSLPIMGDILFTYAATTGTAVPTQCLDLLWLLGTVTIAAPALHPRMGAPLRTGRPGDTLSGRRLVLFALLTAVVPVLSGLNDITGVAVPAARLARGAWVQTILGVSVAVLLVLRMGMLNAVTQRRSAALEEALREQQALRAELEHRATHDPLTGLGNRAALLAALHAALARPIGARGWLILLDLDGFKTVNDTYGHPVGDALLVALARDFTGAVPGAGRLARLGGDEFAIVLPDADEAGATRLAGRILLLAARRRQVEDAPVAVSASLGLLPLDRATGAAAALRDADIALYAAKGAGRNQYRIGAAGPAAPDYQLSGEPARR